MLITYLIIFLLAAIPFFEIAAIIPIAIIGGIPAVPTMVIAFLGNMATIVLLIVFVDKVKTWQKNRKRNKQVKERSTEEIAVGASTENSVQEEVDDSKKHKRARNIWSKYGLPGLAFIGPLLVGSHLSAFLAISFGGTKQRTLALMTASLVAWSIVLGIGSYFGFDYFIADEDNLGFITRLLRIES